MKIVKVDKHFNPNGSVTIIYTFADSRKIGINDEADLPRDAFEEVDNWRHKKGTYLDKIQQSERRVDIKLKEFIESEGV